jgi:hypothetical protein
MNIIAEKSHAFLTEDVENWIVNFRDTLETKLISKAKDTEFPLACVVKWGYIPVNLPRLDQIAAATAS